MGLLHLITSEEAVCSQLLATLLKALGDFSECGTLNTPHPQLLPTVTNLGATKQVKVKMKLTPFLYD